MDTGAVRSSCSVFALRSSLKDFIVSRGSIMPESTIMIIKKVDISADIAKSVVILNAAPPIARNSTRNT